MRPGESHGAVSMKLGSPKSPMTRRRAALVLGFAATGIARGAARAQAKYPDHPVRVIVPFAAGGVADITTRLVADKLSDKLGQRFVVENQPGAGGITAAHTALAGELNRKSSHE